MPIRRLATALRFLRKTDPSESEYPVEQLKLLHAEVDRQRSMLAQRLANLHTRATILVTTAGVLTTFAIANWQSLWQVAGVLLSGVAAIIGVIAMRPRRGLEANATLSFKERLSADPYSAEYSIVEDSMAALEDDFQRVESTGQLVIWGYGILVAAWMATLVVVTLLHLNII